MNFKEFLEAFVKAESNIGTQPQNIFFGQLEYNKLALIYIKPSCNYSLVIEDYYNTLHKFRPNTGLIIKEEYLDSTNGKTLALANIKEVMWISSSL